MTTDLDIAVRAFVLPIDPETGKPAPLAHPVDAEKELPEPSPHALILDCETTTCPAQRLRFGVFQTRKHDDLQKVGIFYDRDALSEGEFSRLQSYAALHGLELMTARDFVRKVFFIYAYDFRASVIGFNLPFDLSRLAIGHGSAQDEMYGGFSLVLTKDPRRSRLRIKHLSRSAAFMKFASPGEQEAARSDRKKGNKPTPHLGFFYDCKTISKALTSRSFTLEALCDELKTETRKRGTMEHGAPLTDEYLDYACDDVQATWECFVILRERYERLGLSKPLHKILSEASLGKAQLRDMGVKPMLTVQPNVPPELLGKVMCSYFGGRAEVRIRRKITRVIHTDFQSMYPSVNALMSLWEFVVAKHFTWREATAKARALLASLTMDDLQDSRTWKGLRILVRVKPHGYILPTRAKYDGKVYTIGLNKLTSDKALWLTLADCVAAKLLGGKAPEIIEALEFEPGPIQEDLKPVDLLGDERFHIDPRATDAFVELVKARAQAKASGSSDDQLKALAIKILTNAMSYGIFIEINRDDKSEPVGIQVYGPDGVGRRDRTKAVERPGEFFHPLLATLITGAARLMLALAECRIAAEGLEWVFCDTDSMAIAKPDGMSESDFRTRVDRVVGWFARLNPYGESKSILKKEDVNFDPLTGEMDELFAYAISAKRYVLFTLKGRIPVIRKASQHGLGHLIAPYRAGQAPDHIQAPEDWADLGIQRWQHDLWYEIIIAALHGHPNEVPLGALPNFSEPAMSRYGATSTNMLGWMDTYNEGRPYAQQIKPFNFMLAFMLKRYFRAPIAIEEKPEKAKKGRPKKAPVPKPVAAYEPDPETAARQVFDRQTGEQLDPSDLMTYAQALSDYHLSCEHKFENGELFDRGETRRRHVRARGVRLIGKESNRYDDDMPADVDAEDVTEYGTSSPTPRRNQSLA